MTAKTTHAPTDFATIVPVTAMYGTMAVALVWLGIGSVMARRWARALLLVFSWSWLVVGVIAVIVMAFVLPKILTNLPADATNGQPALPAESMGIMMAVMFLFYGVLFVMMPAAWMFFYQSRHVRATCEARDPVARWTDACPLPVLGLCVWLWISAAMMLVMPVSGHAVMPFYGVFLTGLPATLWCLTVAVLWGCAAGLLYRLDPRGWWLILTAMCLIMVSSLLTFARHDVLEMYQLMGYPEAQIQQIQQTGLLEGNRMAWLIALSALPFLGYILFIRKFLRHKSCQA